MWSVQDVVPEGQGVPVGLVEPASQAEPMGAVHRPWHELLVARG